MNKNGVPDIRSEPMDLRDNEGFQDIDLLDGTADEKEMLKVSAADEPVFGTGGAGDAAQGSYASSIRMSDIEDQNTPATASDKEGEGQDLMQL